jgi:hypothetical protein
MKDKEIQFNADEFVGVVEDVRDQVIGKRMLFIVASNPGLTPRAISFRSFGASGLVKRVRRP